jgi:F-type H+-transporting ATPase subunit b
MNFSWWTFALQAANFLFLIWLLQRFLFKPVKAIVARRREEIAQALTQASAERQAAERVTQEIEAARSKIRAEQQTMLDEARAQLSAERQRMIEDARREAEKVRVQALKRLEEERVGASEKLYERTVELAINLAERLLREIAVGSIERPFLERVIAYLDQMLPAERAKLLPRNGASTVLVTTAHPLDVSEQSAWRDELAKRLGGGLGVAFESDATLIAGAVLTFPHAILNFNWRDSLVLALKELHGDEHSR